MRLACATLLVVAEFGYHRQTGLVKMQEHGVQYKGHAPRVPGQGHVPRVLDIYPGSLDSLHSAY